jgi:hypothetical protein
MMPVPGGALIRHIEKSEDGDVAVSVCFVHADDKTALQSSQFSNSGPPPIRFYVRHACGAICLAPTHDRRADGMPRPELRSVQQYEEQLWITKAPERHGTGCAYRGRNSRSY